MEDLSHRFTAGVVDDGTWLAVSTRAPYFCFSGDSQSEVEDKANRALDFYFGTKGKITNRKSVQPRGTRQKTLATFSPKKTVERSEGGLTEK